ncbi:hypothetical protein DFH06DRAFT_1445324 [Mycena polygramma]|nr:hypothetical protein DFH06DRAFT_1445324 [Mycena polygramma]
MRVLLDKPTLLATFLTLTSYTRAYTWPSPKLDALESLRFDIDRHPVASFVQPCTFFLFSVNGPSGRSNVADWIRTAYHDMATHNSTDGTGGMDARFPEEQTRAENAADGFNNTIRILGNVVNRYVSRAITAIENWCVSPSFPSLPSTPPHVSFHATFCRLRYRSYPYQCPGLSPFHYRYITLTILPVPVPSSELSQSSKRPINANPPSLPPSGGPNIPFRGGRIDAPAPNAPGVPQPQDALAAHAAAFKRQGFEKREEMISLVACGCVFRVLFLVFFFSSFWNDALLFDVRVYASRC